MTATITSSEPTAQMIADGKLIVTVNFTVDPVAQLPQFEGELGVFKGKLEEQASGILGFEPPQFDVQISPENNVITVSFTANKAHAEKLKEDSVVRRLADATFDYLTQRAEQLPAA
jgi:hypothetical protein